MTDRRTDGQTDGRTDGGDCNIPDAFLKKRGDNYSTCSASYEKFATKPDIVTLLIYLL